MRDAAGELAERLQPLAVLERFLGLLSLGGLGMQVLRPPQRQRQEQEQQRGGGQAEDQMLAHGGEPARADRRSLEAGADIDRVFGEPLVAEPAFEAVGGRGCRDQAGVGLAAILLPSGPRGSRRRSRSALRKARQHHAAGQAEGEEAAGIAADPRVEILEIFRQNRSLDYAGKTAVLVRAPPADAKEWRALIGRPRRQRIADIGADIAWRHAPGNNRGRKNRYRAAATPGC